MLRDKTRAQKFEPLTGNLGNNRWIVQKPPTAKRHQVIKLARGHAQFMLVFAGQERGQETHVRILCADLLQGPDVRAAHTVTRVLESRINSAAHSYHQSQRKPALARGGQDDFADQPIANIAVWVSEFSRKRNRHVERSHSSYPRIEKVA